MEAVLSRAAFLLGLKEQIIYGKLEVNPQQ